LQGTLLLSNSSQANDRKKEIGTHIFSRAECELPEQGIVFCRFNNNCRILPDILDEDTRLSRRERALASGRQGGCICKFEKRSYGKWGQSRSIDICHSHVVAGAYGKTSARGFVSRLRDPNQNSSALLRFLAQWLLKRLPASG
jgi:hypothetical protein